MASAYLMHNVFRLNDDDKLEYEATADDSEQDNVQLAVDICPMQAISFSKAE